MKVSSDYLAGLVDAEGCIDVQYLYPQHQRKGAATHVRPRVRITLAEVALPLLSALKAQYGGRLSHREQSSANEKWSDSSTLEWNGAKEVQQILNEIFPYLLIKKEQAKLALWWMENAKGVHATRCPGIDQAREALAEELQTMKKDGTRLSAAAEQRISAYLAQRKWSRDFERCIDCGTTKKPHSARGRCQTCASRYQKSRRKQKS